MKNPRLKILHVGPLPPPVGGMATVVENLSEALASTCDVRVLNNRKQTPINRTLLQGIISQLVLLARLANQCVSWSPDVVHIHTCSWFSFWRSCIDVGLVRLLRKRAILHIHGGQFQHFLNTLSPVQARIARIMFRQCHTVIVLGKSWKKLLDLWCMPSRVVVIPNGVPVKSIRIINKLDTFTIVCLANYTPGKGQVDLLKAAAAIRIKNKQLKIALLGCETEVGQRQSLLDTAKALGLASCIEAPGPVMGADKEAWWSCASCFCLPSYDEGLPMSMLEAMALGIPIIATQVGAIPEAVEQGKEGLLYEPGDIPTLTSHLQTLFDDPQLAQSVGLAGRARLIRELSLEQCVTLLLDIYSGCL